MVITDVRIRLITEGNDRLLAICAVEMDDEFVIWGIKVIQGRNGLFVAMPDSKVMDCCPKCHGKNHLRAHFCNKCGKKLEEKRAECDAHGYEKLHIDIVHPVNNGCRQYMKEVILDAYEDEIQEAKRPGYVSRYDSEQSEEFIPPPIIIN